MRYSRLFVHTSQRRHPHGDSGNLCGHKLTSWRRSMDLISDLAISALTPPQVEEEVVEGPSEEAEADSEIRVCCLSLLNCTNQLMVSS
jgi:hypothetical protein